MILFSLLTFFFAALTYYALSLKPLSYPRTLLMQFSSMLTNKLLPAGIGGIGLNYVYLRKSNLSKAEAASTIAVNNFLGLFGHLLLFLLVLAIFHPAVSDFHIDHSIESKHFLIEMFVVIAFGALFIALLHYASKLHELFNGILTQLSHLSRHPIRLTFALCSSISLTLCNVICLYMATRAVGINITFMHVLIVFTFGILIGSATPTPGGIGGMETGLIAAFVSYRVSYADALAVVLIYRLVSYWFTLFLGIIAFVFARQNNYF